MFESQMLFGLTGALLFGLGLRSTMLHTLVLGRIIAFNISGLGLFLRFVSVAYRGDGLLPDAVPQALVLTGIVVAVSATAFALTLARRIERVERQTDD
jgi:multicomponent Na+:H+ antiporter subunit C